MRAVATLVALAAVVGTAPAHARMADSFGPLVANCGTGTTAWVGTDGPDRVQTRVYGNRLGFGGDDVITGSGSAGKCLGGGDGDDVLVGANGLENFDGRSGDDRILARASRDFLAGGTGDDFLDGGLTRDFINGGPGNDVLIGGGGRDYLDPGAGAGRISAGVENDRIAALNGERDRIDCGPGDDRVRADPVDLLANCERVRRRRHPVYPTMRRAGSGFDVRIDLPVAVADFPNARQGFRLELSSRPKPRAGCTRDAFTSASNEEHVPTVNEGHPTEPVIHRLRPRAGTRPCAGTYRWKVVYFDDSEERIDCDTLAESRTHPEYDAIETQVPETRVRDVCPFDVTVGVVRGTVRGR